MSAPGPPRRRFITPVSEVDDATVAATVEQIELGARRRAAGLQAAETRRRRERERADVFGTALAKLDPPDETEDDHGHW